MTTLRNRHDIPVFERSPTGAALLTMDQAAAAVSVSPMTIRRLIIRKVLPATQPVPYAPWAIRREDLELEPVQRAITALKNDRRLPQPATDTQLMLVNSPT